MAVWSLLWDSPLINIGVATGVLPTTGLPLPLFSYGGSSSLASLFISALLIRVARESSEAESSLTTITTRLEISNSYYELKHPFVLKYKEEALSSTELRKQYDLYRRSDSTYRSEPRDVPLLFRIRNERHRGTCFARC